MREVTEEVDEAQERGKEEEARERPTSSTTDNTPPPQPRSYHPRHSAQSPANSKHAPHSDGFKHVCM